MKLSKRSKRLLERRKIERALTDSLIRTTATYYHPGIYLIFIWGWWCIYVEGRRGLIRFHSRYALKKSAHNTIRILEND